ncbi:MAG TPA: beta-phosphoglucomutase family hydrolase [Bacteroidetes bacterium]|nr:beta-phosphoglucomutase family hydrolase [Bacteroidota bacterium]
MDQVLTPEEVVLKIKSSFSALIFDLDGTLADSNPTHLEAWTRACKAFGIEYPRDKFYYFAGLSSLKIAEEILKTYGKKEGISAYDLSARKEKEFDLLQEKVKPIEPVMHIVRHFYGKLPMAVGTGRLRNSTVKTLDHLDLTPYFNVIVTADDVKHHKPKPDTFLLCAQKMGVTSQDCLVFEDAQRGLEAARNAGMEVIDVTHWKPQMKLLNIF